MFSEEWQIWKMSLSKYEILLQMNVLHDFS